MTDVTIHSFIVKIVIEQVASGDEQLKWYGQVTHVASDERCYVKRLDQIIEFIKSYLSFEERG